MVCAIVPRVCSFGSSTNLQPPAQRCSKHCCLVCFTACGPMSLHMPLNHPPTNCEASSLQIDLGGRPGMY